MRMPRISIQNALYYVTSRGDNNENIFAEENDYSLYLELLAKAKIQYGFKLFAFCLMPNHLHLLIELKEGTTISQIMHNLNSSYTKQFNKKYFKQGHLFQERYKLVLAEKGAYLLELTAYIHLNPVVLNFVKQAQDYRYSSYTLYCGEKGFLDLKEEIREVSEFIKGTDYAVYINSFLVNQSKALSEELNRKTVLGSDEFTQKIKEEIETTKLQNEKIAGSEEKLQKDKKLIFAGIILILILILSSGLLYWNSVSVKDRLNKEYTKKSLEADSRLAEEKKVITQDLDEKYRADMTAYRAMQKRLELEKKKTKELEEKLGEKTKQADKKEAIKSGAK